MKIGEIYSHLNGREHIEYHKPTLWKEIETVISRVDANEHKTKVSKEKTMRGKLLYAPIELNKRMEEEFSRFKWESKRAYYWVTRDAKLIRRTLHMPREEQRKTIESAGEIAINSYNQTDFVKDRVAVEVQLGKYSFVAYDLFVKHLAFYVRDLIDVGVEIVPMKSLQAEMSSGPPYYEGELYNLIREGRGVPHVPLVLIGVTP